MPLLAARLPATAPANVRVVQGDFLDVDLDALLGDEPKPVELVTPLMDRALIDRVCNNGRADECEHMKRENLRRQALADAGARASAAEALRDGARVARGKTGVLHRTAA